MKRSGICRGFRNLRSSGEAAEMTGFKARNGKEMAWIAFSRTYPNSIGLSVFDRVDSIDEPCFIICASSVRHIGEEEFSR